jgi:hypothetical protein
MDRFDGNICLDTIALPRSERRKVGPWARKFGCVRAPTLERVGYYLNVPSGQSRGRGRAPLKGRAIIAAPPRDKPGATPAFG